MSRFPAAFRPPAFASRSPCSRPGAGPSSRSAYRPPPGSRTRTGFPRSAPARYDRGGCPLYPRDGGARPGRMPCPAVACRFPAASPCTPLLHPTGGATHHEASTRVHAIHPSGLPLACNPRMGREVLGLSPVLRTPLLPAAHDRAGPGVSTRPELRDRHHRPPIREFTRKVRPRVATANEYVCDKSGNA